MTRRDANGKTRDSNNHNAQNMGVITIITYLFDFFFYQGFWDSEIHFEQTKNEFGFAKNHQKIKFYEIPYLRTKILPQYFPV